jgi:dipeptidyl aminopeptidase/acylaminoacyl peptidase
VVQHVDFSERNAQGFFSVSQTGTLIFTNGVLANDQMAIFDRAGKRLGVISKPGALISPAISPNGETVAFDWQDPQSGTWDIWTHDLAHNTDSRLTSDPANDRYPTWSPDGRHVVFASNRGGATRLYRRSSSGMGSDELLLDTPSLFRPTDWSRDGRYLFFLVTTPATKTDIWVLPNPGSLAAAEAISRSGLGFRRDCRHTLARWPLAGLRIGPNPVTRSLRDEFSR